MNATRTVKEFWDRVLEGLRYNDYDVPFALLYSIVESGDDDTNTSSVDGPTSAKLEGSICVPSGHPISPDTFDLREKDEGLGPAFRKAMRTLEPIMLQTKEGTLPESLLEGIEWRGYGDPCREALILPLRPTNADNVCALLLLGINPRRAYDQEYKSFTAMLYRHIATSLASVLLFEDEVRRSKHAAEVATMQREQLSQQLQLHTSRMRRMTELSPLGMYLYDPDGRLLEANRRYYEMTGFPRETSGYEHWSTADVFLGESKKTGFEMWDHIVRTKQPISRELRFRDPKVRPRDLHGEPIEFWVLASSQPEVAPDGELMSIMGSITDISHIKWAQGLQERRLREAEEAKRQQNEFIDITSHEMRNPLSAISICADDIRDTLTHHDFSQRADQRVAADCIEAAKTISLCVQHQKAIVDDILTVSKLDSNLLTITPVPVQPVDVVKRAMTMFRAEMQSKKIESKFVAHEQLEKLGIDWVLLDPSRLLQIIINLITNAVSPENQDSCSVTNNLLDQVHSGPPETLHIGSRLCPRGPARLRCSPGLRVCPRAEWDQEFCHWRRVGLRSAPLPSF
jgi:PAS domain S-box-containing protein